MGGDGIVADQAAAETPEDRIRIRLRELSDAAGIALPRLEVVEASSWRPPARVRAGRTVVAAVTLSTAPAAERDWHLALALAGIVSRRARALHGLALALLLAYLFIGYVLIVGSVLDGLRRWIAVAVLLVVTEAFRLVKSLIRRSEQRALDDAGRKILLAAGLDPAVVARAALGSEPDIPRRRRPFSEVPPARERIAAAERHAPQPAPPLH